MIGRRTRHGRARECRRTKTRSSVKDRMTSEPGQMRIGITRMQTLAIGTAVAVAAHTALPGVDLLAPDPAHAQDGREPLGGQPPAGSAPSVPDLARQVAYQRAFEAVLWAIFVDPMDPKFERYSTLPFHDARLFDDLYEIVSVEPVRPQDMVMMGMFASIGIRQGAPLAPDAAMRTIRANADGSVTLYVGPASPAGFGSNWIPTAGKRPLPAMRFYGQTEAFNAKTFTLADFELVG